jgi:glycosyltransferase involved in cell wall biosynthesis
MLLDVTHTSHTRAQTGIQRVVRSLAAELVRLGALHPVCFDPHQHGWRALDQRERATLADHSGITASRGARWTLSQKLLGRAKRLVGRRPVPPAADAVLCPELFSARAGAQLTDLFARVRGSRGAIFHDAIGLKFPEHTPPATVARLPSYLRELAQFDGVAAVSQDSAESLREFWRWAEVRNPPPIVTIPLGVDAPPMRPPTPTGAPLRVLCVSTLEARKNHAALLDAAETLWREGLAFELELIGLARADTGAGALARIRALQAAGRPLLYPGAVRETELHAAYARCAFTIYPSLYEGFGLPVIESLQHGRPCICSTRGALAEVVPGGGVLALPQPHAAALTAALRRLVTSPEARDTLTAEARTRRFRTWRDYATEVNDWLADLPRRP